jgi:putative AlgH/UPF0301 family transcriptional regulator
MDTCLKHHFLLTMPGLTTDYFGNSITYICEHNDDGAMGLIVNRPMDLSVADVLAQIGITVSAELDTPVLEGGPVQTDRGFILHSDGLPSVTPAGTGVSSRTSLRPTPGSLARPARTFSLTCRSKNASTRPPRHSASTST